MNADEKYTYMLYIWEMQNELNSKIAKRIIDIESRIEKLEQIEVDKDREIQEDLERE